MLPTTEIGGSVSITNTLRAYTENWTDPTIQPTIIHFKQVTGPGHSDPNHFPIKSLNIGTDVPRSGRNIDNHTRMNPQGPIVNINPESNGSNNFNIFDSVSRASDLAYRSSPWHGTMKSENKKLSGKP